MCGSSKCLPFETILRHGQSCGETWKALNGVVQGGSFSLVMVACIVGLWMEGLNQQVPEIKATTMVDDRSLYVVGTERFRILEEAIEYTKTYDEEVGKKFNNKTSTVATSLMSEQKDMKVVKRQKLKHVTSEEQMGYQLSQGKHRNREVQNERVAKATITINRIGTIRNIHALGVEGGVAGKEACASLTSTITTVLWRDQRGRCKNALLTTSILETVREEVETEEPTCVFDNAALESRRDARTDTNRDMAMRRSKRDQEGRQGDRRSTDRFGHHEARCVQSRTSVKNTDQCASGNRS